jgi:hypothetical protein
MDPAVAIVQAYLRVNGFLTVTEYPILHRREHGEFREVTDIDVLAIRMPYAGRVLPRPRPHGARMFANDPALDLAWGRGELIVAEVKEGEATLNPALFRRDVLYEALRRFGVAGRDSLPGLADALVEHGEARTSDGTRVRLLAFGTRAPRQRTVPFHFVPLAAVMEFLRGYLRAHWNVQVGSGFRDEVLAFLALLEKADRSAVPPEGA